MKPFIFTPLFVLSWAVFAWSVHRLYRYLLVGRRDDGHPRFDRLGQRIADVVVYFFAQKKVGEPVSYDAARRGITAKHHLFIFWGFLIIQVAALETFLLGFSGDRLNFSFIGAGPYHVLKLVVDWFNLLVVAMVLYGFFRRI